MERRWGFRNHSQIAQITKVSVTPGVCGTQMGKYNQVHNPVMPLTCSMPYPAHLDREDICCVSRVHGEQLLVVQRVPHNRVLVIGTRGQQTASRMKVSDVSSSS